MSIPFNSIVAGALTTVWTQCAQLVKAGTYTHVGTPTYDPVTGIPTPVNTAVAVNALILGFKTKEIDGEVVKNGDQKLLVRASEMTGITEAGVDDYFTETATATVWRVLSFMLDPTKQFYVFHARRGSA